MCFVPCLVVAAAAAVAQCRTNCTVNKVKIGLDTPRPTRRCPLGPNYELIRSPLVHYYIPLADPTKAA